MGGRVVDVDRGDRGARNKDTPCFAQHFGWIGDMLEEPHHPDMVERLVLERERVCVSLTQGGLDTGALEVAPGELELLRLDVDAVEADTGELLPEDRQHCADAAPDLE